MLTAHPASHTAKILSRRCERSVVHRLQKITGLGILYHVPNLPILASKLNNKAVSLFMPCLYSKVKFIFLKVNIAPKRLTLLNSIQIEF